MKVKILKTDERLGIKVGEVYQAERYFYDPKEKVTLLAREPDGYSPECNQYVRGDVAFLIQNKWRYVDEDGRYVDYKEQVVNN